MMRFENRHAAGELLANRLTSRSWNAPFVLALVRGGIDVAVPVAAVLGAPLDVAVARKIGAPGRPELGVGAVTSDGPPIYDEDMLAQLGLDEADVAASCAAERAEAQRRERTYREGRPSPELAGRDTVLVDDGIATGVSARAAARSIREAGPASVVLAVPVAAGQSIDVLRSEADEIVCLECPDDLGAVGSWYLDFEQLTDADVLDRLSRVDRV